MYFIGKLVFLSRSNARTSGLYWGHSINSTFIRHLRSMVSLARYQEKRLFFPIHAIHIL